MEETDEFKQQRIQEAIKMQKAKVMAARDNLLDHPHLSGVLHSLFQKDEKDASIDMAVKKASQDMSGKGRTKITLEERLALHDNVEHAVGNVVMPELSRKFTELMDRHHKCTQCTRDCPALKWSKYGVHTLEECEQYCKVIVCKEWDDPDRPLEQAAARFEEDRKKRADNPKYAKTSVFQNYLPDYLREYGAEAAVINDDGEYEVTWDVPDNQTYHRVDYEEIHPDSMETLREQPRAPGRSAEDVLAEISRQEEADKLVPALNTPQAMDNNNVMMTRKDLDRELKMQARESASPELF